MSMLRDIWRLIRAWFRTEVAHATPPSIALEAAIPEIAGVMADEVRLTEELTKARNMADVWTGRAERAAYNGRDDEAREAIARKLEHEERVRILAAELERQRATVAKLRADLAPIEAAAREERRAAALVAVREQRAKAREAVTLGAQITEARAEQAAHREARAEAEAELRGDATAGRFEAAERAERIDAELRALKAKHATRGELPGKEQSK